MVNILDLLAEQKSKAKFLKTKDDARDYFVKQKSSILNISNTEGYKEIREYWAREVISCQERLRTMKSDDIKGVQAELNLAMRFLDFLDNLETELE